jgi:hypothetical protein
MQAPILRLPPELLAPVFGLVVGVLPFSAQEYRQFNHLRGSCRTWRNVVGNAPHLCPGIRIDLGDVRLGLDEGRLDDDDEVPDILAPWLSFVANSPGYHLIVTDYTSETHPRDFKLGAILRHLVLAKPRPAKLSIASHVATQGLMKLGTACPDVKDLEILGRGAEFVWDMTGISTTFPHVRTLIPECKLPFQLSLFLIHHTLRTLHLGDARGDAAGLSQLLQTLPLLKELKLYCRDVLTIPTGSETPVTLPPHQRLETLILGSQDMFALLLGISFPSLRLFSMDGMLILCGEALYTTYIPRFLRQLHGRQIDLTVSLRGSLFPKVMNAFTEHLPPRTRLYIEMIQDDTEWPSGADVDFKDDIEAIFCTKETLYWLVKVRCRRASTHLTKIYVPFETSEEHEVEARRDELRTMGYDMEGRSADVLTSIVCSSIPQTSLDWF